jgi:hypothetical protein
MVQQAFNLAIVEKPNYLHVHTRGMRSRENVNYIAVNIVNSALEKHLSKILLDIRELEGELGYQDILALAKDKLINLRGKGVDQVAVIDIHRTVKNNWFLEYVSNIHKLNIRVFTEEESALRWLNG